MAEIAQAVDHRHRGPFGQFNHMFVLENARHHRLNVAGEDAGNIRNRFAFAQTDFRRGKIERITTHMAHGHIERDTRPQAGFLENQGQHLALEQGFIPAREVLLFQADGQVENILNFCRGIIGNIEEMFHAFSLL